MNQLPSSTSSSPVPELHFMSDWTKSFNLVIETVTTAPIPVACVFGTAMAQLALPKVPGWGLLQTVITFFILAKLIQVTYKSLVPESRQRPELFPTNPEFKMLGAALLVNIGTMIGMFFFFIPGIWFAMIHALTQEIVVLEGCGIFEAMSKSRQLMAGNIWRIATYCCFLPLAVGLVAMIVVGIACGIFYFAGGVIMRGDVGHEILKNMIVAVFTVVFMALGLTFKTLAVRAYVHLMHQSGNRTGIEQQLGNNIGMS